MNRYAIIVVVRAEDGSGPEKQYETGATAKSEMAARRVTLERAWATGNVVSRFVAIEEVARGY